MACISPKNLKIINYDLQKYLPLFLGEQNNEISEKLCGKTFKYLTQSHYKQSDRKPI